MSQSNVIAGAIAIGFLLFITLRGELPDYFRLFKPQKHQAVTVSDSGGSGGGNGLTSLVSSAKDVAQYAEIAATFLA